LICLTKRRRTGPPGDDERRISAARRIPRTALERLEQEYLSIVEALRRIEAILTDEHGRREILERSLADLKERVALLQARIDELERRLGA
jgi:predicted  nucleic acid-binding Zn-ribbon protein